MSKSLKVDFTDIDDTPVTRKNSPNESTFKRQLEERGWLEGVDFFHNYRFIPGRRYEGDFVFPHEGIVVELDGAVFRGTKGGHTNGVGYIRDREKEHLGLLNGWLTVRFVSQQVKSGDAFKIFSQVADIWGSRARPHPSGD